MAEPLRLLVWSPSETVLDLGGIAWVHVELAGSGGLTVWPGHLPTIGELAPGPIRYRDAGGEHSLSVPAGIVHIRSGTVTVFLAGGSGEPTGEEAAGSGRFERLARDMVAALATAAPPAPREGGADRER